MNESTGSWHGDLRHYKHKNLLVIFFFMSPAVTSQTSLIFSFAKSVNKQGCGTGRYIELHVWSSHQHERARQLYVCAFIHRRIYPRLVHVSRPRSFREHYYYLIIIIFLFIYDIILLHFVLSFVLGCIIIIIMCKRKEGSKKVCNTLSLQKKRLT